jgi:hypothetical protein
VRRYQCWAIITDNPNGTSYTSPTCIVRPQGSTTSRSALSKATQETGSFPHCRRLHRPLLVLAKDLQATIGWQRAHYRRHQSPDIVGVSLAIEEQLQRARAVIPAR